ncbi:zinc finger protein 474-like [Macrosteles quadrilineatus]|uniref:zinc finger protein 474-like n=1 Tax=Macrosteles quadrilineatus TaxID=74068 RepID=UPI0023E0F7D2|nr:zinc finger protein 474-like [Macrosteles quadrilineatus]
MSVRVGHPPPHLWSVVRRMQLKPGAKPRPDTATLDRPLVLDPQLLRKVDMTRLTRDRLMTIENLISSPKKTRGSPRAKEKSGKPLAKSKSKYEKEDWQDQKNSNEEFPRKNSRVINTTFRVRSHVRKGLREVFSPPQTKEKISPKLKEKDKKVEDVFGTLILSDTVPSPCSTCGRSERPERLHAHPSVPQNKRTKLKEDQENTVVQKSSVTKPVAMKFRSGKTKGKMEMQRASSLADQLKPKEQKRVPLIRSETFKIERDAKLVKKKTPSPSPSRKGSLVHPPPRRPALPRTPEKSPRAVSPAPPPIPVTSNPVVHSASPRRPRTVTCYLCQKQFGTASYPLHEPQCLQKWHRENQALPVSQQQETPRRPERERDGEIAWENAWEAAQAAMVACEGCSKTFLPHRLEAHQRVCPNNNNVNNINNNNNPYKKPVQARVLQDIESDREEGSERSVLLDGPTSVHCHICGRVFNRAAVERHEQQCLRRWQLEHSRDSGSSAPASAASSPPSSAPSTPRRRLVLCYLCGRQFGSASIAIHEPQCLRRWRQENDRLPAAQRRAEPAKPDVVYDPDGHVDIQATAEAQWQCHLVQLVPCGKCGRTFNPDRISVHEKCCKGPVKH